MSLSMYQASVPVFVAMLNNLTAILEKAEAFAKERKIEEGVLLNLATRTRHVSLHPPSADRRGLRQRHHGTARRRRSPELCGRRGELRRAQAAHRQAGCLRQNLQPGDVDGSEDRDITLTVGGQELHFKGQPYLLHFALPNFYFHATIAYGLLRACGLGIGKLDFIGSI